MAVDSHKNAVIAANPDLRPRFGRFLCRCEEYAAFEICPMTCALGRVEASPDDDHWEQTREIR